MHSVPSSLVGVLECVSEPPGKRAKSEFGPPAQMTMPATRASKLCARSLSQCPEMFFVELSSLVIPGMIEPWLGPWGPPLKFCIPLGGSLSARWATCARGRRTHIQQSQMRMRSGRRCEFSQGGLSPLEESIFRNIIMPAAVWHLTSIPPMAALV